MAPVVHLGRLGAIALWLAALACGGSPATPIDAPDGPGQPVDAAPDAPPPQPPRLIAPLSMATVTQQQPLLRWAMPDDTVAPAVDLCRDRACTTPLTVTVGIADDGRSAVPQTALPPGWVFWRVRARSGRQAVQSATWQFWVGRSNVTSLVDTGNGVILDVNGDGYADLLVGAPRAFSEAGIVYLYLGSATAGAAGWNGASPAARISIFGELGAGDFGAALASAGDVNGDGYADFLVGSFGGAGAGVHLYLGSPSPGATGWHGAGAPLRIDLGNPVGGGPAFGASLAGAGDIDGDGYADFAVGASGQAHVYFGAAAPTASDWSAGASSRRIDLSSPSAGDGYGLVVAGPGDVNGDGHADLLVGGSSSSFSTERAYVYLGSAAPSGTDWNKPASTRRIEIVAPAGFNRAFSAVIAGAGDINGDGYADFLISTEFADGGDPTTRTGAAHLYLGSALPVAAGWNGTPASRRVDLVSPDGAGGTFGSALAGAGDVNGDGFADFVVGNFQASQVRGAAHVYLGGADVDPADWNDAVVHPLRIDLTDPDGANARFGGSAATVGDVNGDGFADFVVSTFSDALVSSAAGGNAHLYLGVASPRVAVWNGVAPAARIDLANPAGQGSAFGNAVARRALGTPRRSR
jgi:FG-GAP-like repeat/FG-GAP repeat